MNYPEMLPNGPQGPEFGSFGRVVRSAEVDRISRAIGVHVNKKESMIVTELQAKLSFAAGPKFRPANLM